MSTDDLARTEDALRRALRADADSITPHDRLGEILRDAHDVRLTAVDAPDIGSGVGRRSWFLGAAAAAAVVAAVTAGVVVSERLQPTVPGGRTSQSGPTGQATSGPASQTLSGGTSQPVGAQALALPVYYVSTEAGAGSQLVLVREFVPASAPTGTSAAALTKRVGLAIAATNVRNGAEGALPATSNQTSSGGEVSEVAVSTTGITVTITGPTATYATAQQARMALAAWVYTAQAVVAKGDLPVTFVVQGGASQLFGTFPTTTPWNRAALGTAPLAAIWIDEPSRVQTFASGKTVTVKGLASVFEPTLPWELRKGTKVVASGTTQAARSAPARSAFSFDLGVLPAGDYTVVVRALSAKDGSVAAERSMPFTVG